METDRELLELAAKAAGMKTRPFATDSITRWHERGPKDHTAWNPLTDDADALRLAVKLGISISFSHSTQPSWDAPAIAEVGAFAGWQQTHTEVDSADWAKATRRAIVRAAAAIGKEGHEPR